MHDSNWLTALRMFDSLRLVLTLLPAFLDASEVYLLQQLSMFVIHGVCVCVCSSGSQL